MENLLECAYLLLLLDQYQDGLWGKSITTEEKTVYASIEEGKISEKRKRAESITVAFFATNSIHTFTRNPENSAIKCTLNHLPDHRSDGSYGSFKELISAYPKPKYHILVSCRHTATALLTYLLFQDRIDEKIVQGVQFLLDHSNKDGGWGISADIQKEDSDCLSTAYVTKLLTTVKTMRIDDLLSQEYRSKLGSAITRGLNWLEKENNKNNGFWVFGDESMKLPISAAILVTFHELKKYKKKLYEKTLSKIATFQIENSGWPLSPKGRPELRSTIWAVNALIKSNESKYISQIDGGIGFIVDDFSIQSYMKDLNAADWSKLLELAPYRDIFLSREADDAIQNLAEAINNEKMRSGDVESVWKGLSEKFHITREQMLYILENHRLDMTHRNLIIRMLERIPTWLKWVITAIVLSILLGIISNFLYDLFFRS